MFRVLFLFTIFLAISWSTFPSYDYFPTQNSAYHSALARNYLQKDLAPLLPTSSLNGQFFDQHLIYHILIAPLVQNTAEPWLVLKLVQSAGLALLFLGIFLFIKKTQSWYWAVVPMLFIISQSQAYYRFYFLRIESISILFLFTSIISASYLLNAKRYLWWMLIFFLAVLTSWINLVLLAIPLLKEKESFKLRAKWLFFCCICFLSTFILKGEGLGGINYLGALLNQNFIQDNGISEWEKSADFLKTLLLPALAFFFSALVYIRYTKRTYEQTLLLFYFSLFFILTVYFKRFETCLFVMTGTCFVYFLAYYPVKREVLRSSVGALLVCSLSVSTFIKVMDLWQAPAYATREVTDVRDLYEWSKENKFTPHRIINLRWESWGEMLWYFPSTISEPGLTLSIYKSSVPEATKCISHLRTNDLNIDPTDFFKCSEILQKSFQTDLLMVPLKSQVDDFVKNNPNLASYFFKGKKSALLQLRRAKWDAASLPQFKNRPMNFEWIKPSHFIKEDRLQSFKTFNQFMPMGKSTRLRSVYSAWVLCATDYVPIKDCLAVRNKALEDPMETSAYGTHALLGLLNEHLQDKPDLSRYLYEKYLSDILPTGQFSGIKYDGEGEVFYPGEVLVFLMTASKSMDDYEKIKKALAYYATDYLITDQQFMIRWLVEAILIFRKKFHDHSFDGVFRIIESRINKTLPLVCASFAKNGQSIFQAGLWLEGLAKIPDSLFDPDTKLRAFYCNYDSIQKIRLGNDDVHYFAGTKGSSTFRIDNHAHAWRGFHDYLYGNWIH